MHVVLLERVLQRQRVDDRRQHAHVVGGRAIHALGAGGDAAEDVAAADDDGGLDAPALDVRDLAGDLVGDGRVDAEFLLAHQGFAGQLEENALISGHGGRQYTGRGPTCSAAAATSAANQRRPRAACATRNWSLTTLG